MFDSILNYDRPYLLESRSKIPKAFYEIPMKEISQVFKLFWVTFLVVLSLVSTVLSVALIHASLEYRATQLISAKEIRYNPLEGTIQAKLNYLLNQPVKE